jgi:hypothetical protein
MITDGEQGFAPAATGAVIVGIALFPKTILHAESVEGPNVRFCALRTVLQRALISFAVKKAYLR